MKKLSLSDIRTFIKHDLWAAHQRGLWHDWYKVKNSEECKFRSPNLDDFIGDCLLLLKSCGVFVLVCTMVLAITVLGKWDNITPYVLGLMVLGIGLAIKPVLRSIRTLHQFMRSCDELCELFLISFLDLTKLTRNDLVSRGREILVRIAMKVQSIDELNPHESIRDAFRKPFDLLKGFGYVEDSWKPYFDEARRRRMAEKRIEAEIMSQ